MAQYIDKSAVVAEIERLIDEIYAGRPFDSLSREQQTALWHVKSIMSLINTLEVKDPYEQCIQHPSVKDGIKAHAETYSFNIESLLFNQLTKEQQALWRKEIEQACISGGEVGIELARDPRYKENLEVKEVDLDKCYHDFLQKEWFGKNCNRTMSEMMAFTAKYFFELGLSVNIKAQKGEKV